MKRLGMEEGVPIEHRWVTKSIERAQKQVEARNFDTRKHLLEYDDVMNKQREEIYRLRKEILTGALSHAYVVALAEDVAEDFVDRHCPAGKDHSEWDWKALTSVLGESFGMSPEEAGLSQDSDNNAALKDKLKAALRTYYEQKTARLGADVMKDFEKFFMLQTVDALWKDHLLALDHLKEGIGLRGYGQRDPLVEYKKESFQLFEAMKEAIEEQILQNLFRFEVVRPEEAEARWAPPRPPLPPPPAAPRGPARLPREGSRRRRSRRAPPPSSNGGPRGSGGRCPSRGPPTRPRAGISGSTPSSRPARRSAGTTPAPAAPARSTRSATGPPRPPEPDPGLRPTRSGAAPSGAAPDVL
jgi:Preprotein translocase subunit SecA (ATPase, RNA helicase)